MILIRLLYIIIIIYILEVKFYNLKPSILIIILTISYLFINLKIKNYYNNFNYIIFLIYICFLKGNIQSLLNTIKLKNTFLESQQPTPQYIIKEINYMIKKHTYIQTNMKQMFEILRILKGRLPPNRARLHSARNLGKTRFGACPSCYALTRKITKFTI